MLGEARGGAKLRAENRQVQAPRRDDEQRRAILAAQCGNAAASHAAQCRDCLAVVDDQAIGRNPVEEPQSERPGHGAEKRILANPSRHQEFGMETGAVCPRSFGQKHGRPIVDAKVGENVGPPGQKPHAFEQPRSLEPTADGPG